MMCCVVYLCVFCDLRISVFFFFKQKTAYELRISDWSSDVCSSDLDLTLYASFDDVQDLTPGHNVQASNVVVGSVREISLDGYQAKVRMSIVDDFEVPDGTAAVVQRTSLLGEYYVEDRKSTRLNSSH